MKIWIVDAFTHKPYSGNPAAVTIVKNFPTDSVCQNIATEMNLSETAFVKPLQENFHIRWFTPLTEVKLCGHATLAAAYILYQEIRIKENQIIFESLSGQLKVYKNDPMLTLDFPLQRVSSVLDKKVFQELLDIEIINVQKALDVVIVELPNETLVRNFQPNIEKIKSLDYRGLIITAKGDNNYDFVSRYFVPKVGINEDPVTGSAHCKLADYWQHKLGKTEFFAYQASKRGGEIKLNIKNDRVLLSGHAVTIMQGQWSIK